LPLLPINNLHRQTYVSGREKAVDVQDQASPVGHIDLSVAAPDVAEMSPPMEPLAAPPSELVAFPEPRYFPPTPFSPGADYPVLAAPPPTVQAIPRANTRRLIAIGLGVAVLILAGGGVAGNAVLSSTYSPDRAVIDYFAAQSRGDVSGMMANAAFKAGSEPQFFSRAAVTAMMSVPQNKDVHDTKIVASSSVDSSTQSIAVTMTWAGKPHLQTYTVLKDNSQTHALIYHSWHVVIPFVTVHVNLPNQPGYMQVDGISSTRAGATSIQVVQGYHQLTMSASLLYDATSQTVDGVDEEPTATFAPSVSAAAMSDVADAIKISFTHCDFTKYDGCADHTYSAPNDGYLYYLDVPGYGKVFYSTYRITNVGDPTVGMKVSVLTGAGMLNASGVCKETMTIDGTKQFSLAGSWTAALTWHEASLTFDSLVTADCGTRRA
jgi:hypothetical protein